VSFHVVLRVARALGILDTLTTALDPLDTDLGRARAGQRERARARQASRRARDFDDADYLAGVSDITRQGALRYRSGEDPTDPFLDPGHSVPRMIRLPELLRAADAAARDNDDDFEAVKALLAG
jgi:serine/threonine-protein kinase HipA